MNNKYPLEVFWRRNSLHFTMIFKIEFPALLLKFDFLKGRRRRELKFRIQCKYFLHTEKKSKNQICIWAKIWWTFYFFCTDFDSTYVIPANFYFISFIPNPSPTTTVPTLIFGPYVWNHPIMQMWQSSVEYMEQYSSQGFGNLSSGYSHSVNSVILESTRSVRGLAVHKWSHPFFFDSWPLPPSFHPFY